MKKSTTYPPAKNILALDLSFSNTGWAAMSDGAMESSRQAFNAPKGKAPAIRFQMFNAWLDSLINLQSPDLVIYEEPHLQGRGATHALVGLATRVEETCAVLGIRCVNCHTGTLKKHATGNGAASKEQMKAAAKEKWSWYDPLEDDGGDESDALHLLDYAKKEYGEALP